MSSAWHLSLTDSVHALGAAAREHRTAYHHAHHAAFTADPARIVPVPGLLATPGDQPTRPHHQALQQLHDLYITLEHRTLALYQNAALGYAHGTAWVLTAILRGDHPHHAELPHDPAGRYVLPAHGLPDLAQSLTTSAGGPELASLRTQLLAFQHHAEPTTTLADTAYAYGECAERALHHLLRHAATHGFLREAS